MASFKDNKGREWELAIDATSILRVRAEVDPNFMLGDDEAENNTFMRMAADMVLLCQVIYLLCAKQRQERGIGDEDFYAAIVGDALDAASDALTKTMFFFIPRNKRSWMEAAVAKQRQIDELATKAAVEKLNDPTLEAKIQRSLDERMDEAIVNGLTRLGSVTDLPASPESHPKD